ncbi:helix-turn-helix domain-containing protein [Streptomyces gilvus]|uniref:helix-turn-helix domain-containing protein n=1 Tax=Streptomyces gilvus TaxID=2920937 RepID=UPI001F10E388|nr:helix-turn-helix domain-containing protein [Streptomyces sp. CME 23]MCH5677856.1 helix-turn-helix domain-containing protein [Streptomyces sp. CME 23]
MTRADRLTLVRQLADDGLSQRAIAKRLKVSKDTVRRDLERLATATAPDGAPPAETDSTAAPQVSDDDSEMAAPDDAPQGAPDGAPLAADPAPVAQVARDGGRLVVDLDDFPGLAEDLALLQRAGATAAEVVNFAVDRLATAYRAARDRGLLHDGQAFDVTGMHLKPKAVRPAV